MNSKTSLLGHLTTKFSSHPENIATESLLFILNNYEEARKSLLHFLRNASLSLPRLSFKSQAYEKTTGIPDIVGFESNNTERIVIESKFWAGLTDNQPNEYLKRLPDNEDSVLVFVAPAKRFQTLWREVSSRCQVEYPKVGKTIKNGDEFWYRKLSPQKTLLLTSWNLLLDHLYNTFSSANIHEGASDIKQLKSLCQRMDDISFIPIRSEELSPENAQRQIQLSELLHEIYEKLERKKISKPGGKFKFAGSLGYYGRSFWIYDVGAYLSYDAYSWRDVGETPLWLRLYGIKGWKNDEKVRNALSSLEHTEPAKFIYHDDKYLIPLYVLKNEEKDIVLKNIIEQIEKVANLIKDL